MEQKNRSIEALYEYSRIYGIGAPILSSSGKVFNVTVAGQTFFGHTLDDAVLQAMKLINTPIMGVWICDFDSWIPRVSMNELGPCSLIFGAGSALFRQAGVIYEQGTNPAFELVWMVRRWLGGFRGGKDIPIHILSENRLLTVDLYGRLIREGFSNVWVYSGSNVESIRGFNRLWHSPGATPIEERSEASQFSGVYLSAYHSEHESQVSQSGQSHRSGRDSEVSHEEYGHQRESKRGD